MTLTLVTAPADTPISLSEAKAHCRIESTVVEDDTLVTAYIDAAVDQMERELDYALVTQTWRQTFEAFGCVGIWKRPFAEIVSVKYIDEDDVERTMSEADYRMEHRSFGVVLVPTGAWPVAKSVTIEFTAGVAAVNVPAALKAALMLHVGFLFADRESSTETELRPTGAYEALVWPFRRLAV